MIALLTSALIIFTSCSSSVSKTLSPILIKEWTGNTNKYTESFTIAEDKWAISWVFEPDAPTFGVYANYFGLEVYKAGDYTFPQALIANIANTPEDLTDISYLQGGGNFRLEITSMSGRWHVQVYDYK
jgi:hypothetical protein